MKKLFIISAFVFTTFGFNTPLEGQSLSEKQSEQIEKHIDSVFQKMVTFAEKLDFDAISSGVDDSHGAGFITNNRYYLRYDSLVSDTKSNAQGISKQAISITDKKTTVLSGKIVLMTVSGVAKAYINDGREISVNFHWSFVYEKIGNCWKVIHSHQSIVR